MADKPFAIHVDESMYHSKVRLEFWVIHFVKRIRRVRYLTTIELKTNFDVSAFLTSDSSLKSLDDVKLVSSQAVFDSTIGVLDMFSLSLQNVIHVMTDNCSTMRGSKDGFVSKMKTVCNNLVDVEGCSSHQGNLLTKDMIKEFPFVKAVVNFVENLSNFVENKPKVRSILKESSAFLGILKDFSQRFNLSPTDVADDYVKLRVKITTEFKLINLFLENELTEFPCISKLVECCSVLCPHNMLVESGFSKMKFFEDNYQANFSVDMYNSFRLVADSFSRDAFEDFKPTESLLKLAKSASKMYKDEQSSLQEVEKSDNKKHVEVLVFKRKADKALDRELQEAGKELAEAEIAFVQAKKRKQELEAMKCGVIARRDNVSDEIISSMFS